MKLYVKQKIFTLKDKFAVLDENENIIYTGIGKLFSFGGETIVYDNSEKEVASITGAFFSLFGKYNINIYGKEQFTLKRKFAFFSSKYEIEEEGWTFIGNVFDTNYSVERGNKKIMSVKRKFISWGDSYEITVQDENDALAALCIVLAVDLNRKRDTSASSASV